MTKYSTKRLKNLEDRFDLENMASEVRHGLNMCLDDRISCGEGMNWGKKELLKNTRSVSYYAGINHETINSYYLSDEEKLDELIQSLWSVSLRIYGDVKMLTHCMDYFFVDEIEVVREEGENREVYSIECKIYYDDKYGKKCEEFCKRFKR